LVSSFLQGSYTIGFRLDPFSGAKSTLSVSNVQVGFAGVKDPFSLAIDRINGSPMLKLIGPPGVTYIVESSSNLINWKPSAALVNTNGIVRFTDPETGSSNQRFYRAVAP